MMRRMIVAIALAASPAAAQENPQTAIAAAMDASAAGWNAGSLDRFMVVYAGDAIFVGKDGLIRGKAAIADRYRPSFAPGANRRGMLSFRTLAYRQISNVHQLLFARWTLTPKEGAAESGMTTLLFERRPEGWRIISDHSS